MKLLHLSLLNFKVYKKLDIDFFDGILALIGPNESGKSTIIQSILFALFGSKAEPDFQNLINFESNSASIILDFKIKDTNYRIQRVLSKSKRGDVKQKECEFSKVLDKDRIIPLATKVTDVDPLVQKTIGFSFNELTHSNIISQKKLDKISQLTPSKWKDLFNEFLNLEGFGNAEKELKEEKSKQSISLKNCMIEFSNIEREKDEYWKQFKKLCENSKNHFRKAMQVRSLRKVIEVNMKYLSIVKDFIEKKSKKSELLKEKTHNIEQLQTQKDFLKRIEVLEAENKKLMKQLRDYESIENDEIILIKIKDVFETLKTIFKDAEEIQRKIIYLEKLEKYLKEKEMNFQIYTDMPQQLSTYRQICIHYNSLNNYFTVKNDLKEKLDKINKLEERNQELTQQLSIIKDVFDHREVYNQAENIYQEFKLKLDKIKYEKNEKRTLEREIISIKKKIPEEIPEDLESIKSYKNQYEEKNKTFFTFLLKSSKINLLLLIGLIFLVILPLAFQIYLISLITLIILFVFIIKLLFQYRKIHQIIFSIEEIILRKEQFIEINDFLNKVVVILNNLIFKIKEVLSKLPVFYTEVLEFKDNIEEQELIFQIHFSKINQRLQEFSKQKESAEKEVKKNLEEIIKKPELLSHLNDNFNKISNVRQNLDKEFSDFNNKYSVKNINCLFKEETIDFTSVEEILLFLDSMIQKDLDTYQSLKKDIENLKEQLKEKPEALKKLETTQKSQIQNNNDVIKLTTQFNSKYIKILNEKGGISFLINHLKIFQDTLKELSLVINKDKNINDQLKAQIQTNNKTIINRPTIEHGIKSIETKIEKITLKISEIIFPKIPVEIEFNEIQPEDCQENLELIIKEREKDRNNLTGEMKNINDTRKEKRQYLRDKKDIISSYFIKKEEIKKLEEETKIIETAIEMITSVNKKIQEMQLPYITSYIREFLPKITMGRYRNMIIEQPKTKETKVSKKIKERKYEFKIEDENYGFYVDKELLSGGTEDQILLVLRVAFALSLLPQSKGHYPKFLFLDESFSSSDSERRLEILDWLTKDLLSVFSQIIVISHQQEIIEKIPYHYKLIHGKIVEKVIPNT